MCKLPMKLEVPQIEVGTTSSRRVPIVSIIVVNYNGIAHLEESLSSLVQESYPFCEIIFVDNNSTDGSVDYVRERFPQIRILVSEGNLGYAGAVNLAIPDAVGKYIAVLNMDTVVEPDWLEPLISFLEANPQAAAVTPKILLYDEPRKINALGQNVHVTALGFNRAFNKPAAVGDKVPTRVPGVHGCAFVIRKEVLQRMRGMNQACFMYHEDVDLSWCLTLMGYDIYCIPDSVVRHKYALTMNPQKLFYLERNRWAMLLCNVQWRTFPPLAPALAFTEFLMAIYCIRRGWTFVKAKVHSVLWIWQNLDQIRRRRSWIQNLRRRSDWEIISRLRWAYEWDQLCQLAR